MTANKIVPKGVMHLQIKVVALLIQRTAFLTFFLLRRRDILNSLFPSNTENSCIQSHLCRVDAYFQVRVHSLEASVLYPQALGLYGNWLAESKSENPNTIIEDYLKKVKIVISNIQMHK